MDISYLDSTDQLMARLVAKEEVLGVEGGMDIGVQSIEQKGNSVSKCSNDWLF